MKHQETCLCAKNTVEFTSEFQGDVVTKLYCPTCVSKAPGSAIIFELCEPGVFQGIWGVDYNKAELARLDTKAYRNEDDYFLSLLISGACGPTIARSYKQGGLCRIFGFKHGPNAMKLESKLTGTDDLHD